MRFITSWISSLTTVTVDDDAVVVVVVVVDELIVVDEADVTDSDDSATSKVISLSSSTEYRADSLPRFSLQNKSTGYL